MKSVAFFACLSLVLASAASAAPIPSTDASDTDANPSDRTHMGVPVRTPMETPRLNTPMMENQDLIKRGLELYPGQFDNYPLGAVIMRRDFGALAGAGHGIGPERPVDFTTYNFKGRQEPLPSSNPGTNPPAKRNEPIEHDLSTPPGINSESQRFHPILPRYESSMEEQRFHPILPRYESSMEEQRFHPILPRYESSMEEQRFHPILPRYESSMEEQRFHPILPRQETNEEQEHHHWWSHDGNKNVETTVTTTTTNNNNSNGNGALGRTVVNNNVQTSSH